MRSRLYFSTPTLPEAELDPDLRMLKLMKANRAKPGEKLMLRWADGNFWVVHGDQAAEAMPWARRKTSSSIC